MLRFCKDSGMAIVNLKIQSLESAAGDSRYASEVSLRGSVPSEKLMSMIRQMPGIASVEGQ